MTIASDGLRARVNGSWAETKLAFLDDFGPSAIDVTQRKVDRVFVDLFAGPGRNITSEGGREFEASSIRVLQMSGKLRPDLHFTEAILVNRNRQDALALSARIDRLRRDGRCQIPLENVIQMRGDANVVLEGILGRFHPASYLWVFADIEAPKQFPFSSVERIMGGHHRSVDLYALFPLEMGLIRLASYDRSELRRQAPHLTSYFGTDAWQEIVARRSTSDPDRIRACRRELEDLYIRQLSRFWSHVERVCEVRTTGRRGLYRMLFATNHPAAKSIAQWAKRHRAPGQGQTEMFS